MLMGSDKLQLIESVSSPLYKCDFCGNRYPALTISVYVVYIGTSAVLAINLVCAVANGINQICVVKLMSGVGVCAVASIHIFTVEFTSDSSLR